MFAEGWDEEPTQVAAYEPAVLIASAAAPTAPGRWAGRTAAEIRRACRAELTTTTELPALRV